MNNGNIGGGKKRKLRPHKRKHSQDEWKQPAALVSALLIRFDMCIKGVGQIQRYFRIILEQQHFENIDRELENPA